MNWVLLVHVSCVILAIAGFVLRGVWMMTGSSLLESRWARITPHVVDSLLLAAGATLAIQIHQYPFVNSWLTAKTLGVIVYIGLGMVALKRGRTRRIRVTAWLGALLVLGYIVAVALTRSPLPLGPESVAPVANARAPMPQTVQAVDRENSSRPGGNQPVAHAGITCIRF
ncbi:MAG: SirB2 family protein [Acidiferrobacterales bacterium]